MLFKKVYLLAIFCLVGVGVIKGEELRMEIEDTSTRVSIARVNLSLGEMTYKEGLLTGEYAIKVPISKSRNDNGKIEIVIENINELREVGGTITGYGTSKVDGLRYPIKGDVVPLSANYGLIELEINIGSRLLAFKTEYKL